MAVFICLPQANARNSPQHKRQARARQARRGQDVCNLVVGRRRLPIVHAELLAITRVVNVRGLICKALRRGRSSNVSAINVILTYLFRELNPFTLTDLALHGCGELTAARAVSTRLLIGYVTPIGFLAENAEYRWDKRVTIAPAQHKPRIPLC